MQEKWGRQIVPVQLPIVDEHGFHGVVDLVTMKAYLYKPDGDGRGEVGPIPEANKADAKAAHEALVELVAEGKDELMEEFFEKGTIPEDHLIGALHEAIREDRIFPVLFASGLGNIGTDHILDFLVTYAPTASESAPIRLAPASAGNGAHGNGSSSGETLTVSDSGPLALYVFKTISDPFAGHISFFKVFSGVVKNDATVQ